MAEMMACCGLTCTRCPAYLATQADDDEKRRETAAEWSRRFKVDLQPEEINCDGCLAQTGRVFNYCRVCEIRKCVQEKELDNCASCPEYACERLSRFLELAPEARAGLEKIRTQG